MCGWDTLSAVLGNYTGCWSRHRCTYAASGCYSRDLVLQKSFNFVLGVLPFVQVTRLWKPIASAALTTAKGRLSTTF